MNNEGIKMEQTRRTDKCYIIMPQHKEKRQIMDDKEKQKRAWAEINTENLKHNLQELNHIMPKSCQMMAVVKANAYGHGALEISRILADEGVQAFAVATLKEGIQLRKNGIKGEILILGMTEASNVSLIKKWDLTQTVVDFDHAERLQQENIKIKVHVKIDTGMGRLGEPYYEWRNILKIYQMTNLSITGIYTHLCVADSLDPYDVAFTYGQIRRFYTILNKIRMAHIIPGKIHIQSSYGLLNYPELHSDYVRVGIALYGALSNPNDTIKTKINLRPVLTLKAKIALVKNLQEGDTVGYGRNFTAKNKTRIAVVTIGYADGIPRNLSCGKGSVIIKGKKAPIIGNICMDQLIIDISEIKDTVSCGDEVILIGEYGNQKISPEMFAQNAETITNEILSRIGERVEKIYL